MATQPTNTTQTLPLFYQSIAPLSTVDHAGFGLLERSELGFTRGVHAVPLTVDEFALTQKTMPIVFGTGAGAVPLALLGLSDGENMMVDADGKWREGAYVPAYIRRYPFILAKLTPESTEMSLCFDDAAGALADGEGDPLFADGKPTELTQGVLKFCEEFEQAVQRTQSFMAEVEKLDLLMEGEVTMQLPGQPQPSIYRGFRMVNEEKLQTIRGDQARKMVGNGLMGLIYAHMFSLSEMRSLFERQQALPAAGAFAL